MRSIVSARPTVWPVRLSPRLSPLAALAVVLLLGSRLVGGAAVQAPVAEEPQALAQGVSYQAVDAITPRGTARAHVVEADLWARGVSAELLYPGVVAQRQAVSAMADAQQAIAGVNGDFFNISATQPGVIPTGAPVGPAVTGMDELKAAVPTRQRFGPSLPPGTTVEDVIGVGVDRRGRLGRLILQGMAFTLLGRFDVRGLNQYAIAQNGIGAFTSEWGSVSRQRAICGSDARREDPCSTNVHEVTVRHAHVTEVSPQAGSGEIPEGTTVLLGREGGADELRQLQVGDPVVVHYRLDSSERIPFRFALGGQPIVRDGAPLAGLDAVVAATRSAAGVSADGRRLFLLALDRHAAGMTYAELANLLMSLGAASGVNLDGGGSSTLVARDPGDTEVTARNLAPGDFERPVPNGIGIFVRE